MLGGDPRGGRAVGCAGAGGAGAVGAAGGARAPPPSAASGFRGKGRGGACARARQTSARSRGVGGVSDGCLPRVGFPFARTPARAYCSSVARAACARGGGRRRVDRSVAVARSVGPSSRRVGSVGRVKLRISAAFGVAGRRRRCRSEHSSAAGAAVIGCNVHVGEQHALEPPIRDSLAPFDAWNPPHFFA